MRVRFDEHRTYTNSDIREIRKNYIKLSDGHVIDYAECAANFFQVHGGSGKCVGERNRSELTIVFYTAPLTTHLVYPKAHWLLEFLRINKTSNDFQSQCQLIERAGYTTYDGS